MKRKQVDHMREAYWVSERRAYEAIRIWHSSHQYCSQRRDHRALRLLIREIAETRVWYGYLRIHILLRHEGWHVNHKRVYRIYREEGLKLQRKRPRRHVTGSRRRISRKLSILTLAGAWILKPIASLMGVDSVR